MNFKEISGGELEKNLDSYTIYDVRSEEEYSQGHVKGAINIPHDEVIDHIDQIKNSPKSIVLYCRSNGRSSYAGRILMNEGIDDFIIAPGVALYNYNLVK